jgi:hypothetical protein
MYTGVLLLALLAVGGHANPGPGDVFREYVWKGPWVNAGNWQRVTDPQAGHAGAAVFLPNPVNRVTIGDLSGAVAVEVYIEQWGGHAGTSEKRLRLNGGEWIDIPEPAGIPADAGLEKSPECYQYLTHVTVPLPLEQLVPGENSFEFTAGPQICHNFGWGQWGVYGVTFRVYYDPDSKPHVPGRLTVPDGSGDGPVFSALTDDPEKTQRIDFIARYEDFDYEGNGIYRQWHYTYRYGQIRHHVGSATAVPYAVTWDTEWVPDQAEPVELICRILSTDGLFYMTPPLEFSFERVGRSVRLYRPYDVPGAWQTRVRRRQGCSFFVAHDLRRASSARLLLSTWSGAHADAIGVNDTSLVRRVGLDHDYSHDEIPVDTAFLRPGVNRAFTYSETEHHGIEVLWPGIALKVVYDTPIVESEPVGDLRIYADAVGPGWDAKGPAATARLSETHIDPQSGSDVFEGSAALGIEAPQQAWQLRLQAAVPAGLSGYRALRFAFLPQVAEVSSLTRLDLFIDELQVPLLRGDLPGGVDLEQRQWQVVEIELEDLALRRPYMAELRFSGLFSGKVLLDDIRLVARETGTAVIEDTRPVLTGVSLRQNRPNPFNSQTTIRFELGSAAAVRLELFNVHGQRVVVLASEVYGRGAHRVDWDGRDSQGAPQASGVYFYRLSTAEGRVTRRLLLLR